MPDFAYTARDDHGEKITGTISATTQREALSLLSGRELFPVQIAPAQQAARRLSGRVRPQLVATTYTQLAALLRSGVPLLRSINVVRRQNSNAALIEVLDDLHSQVEEGAALADAMRRHPRVFSEMAVSIVRAGSEGGFLEQALEHVADFTEKQQDIKSRVLGALFYPMLLATAAAVIVGVLVVVIVPRFEAIFARLREIGELPAMTDWLLWVSGGLQRSWLALLVLLAIALVFARSQMRSDAARLWLDGQKMRLPVLGRLLRQMAVARFCRVLGNLLSNGVPILRSLEISSDAAGNLVLASTVRQAAQEITAGQSLARPLAASGEFPVDVMEMIAVAEEANTLERVLIDIADSLDRQIWRRLDLLVRLIEPVMLVIMAAVVMVIVIALLLPMLKMSMTI